MKIGFLVNDLATEDPRYTTTVLALEAHRRGHEVHYLTPHDFAFTPQDVLSIHTVQIGKRKGKSTNLETFLGSIQQLGDSKDTRDVTELDVLMLRNDPASDAEAGEGWVESTVLVFTQEAARRGVLVLNDPEALSRASNKFYFQLFPVDVRPKTLISRDRQEIKAFVKEVGGKAVIKPLQGSGGQSVFLVEKDGSNINQMIDAVARDGYVVAQEYLPAAADGDIRLFLLNGVPLTCKGRYAALLRKGNGGDVRNNMHSGGKAAKAKLTEGALALAELVRPKLVRDGMFFVGLDIAGDKLMEINVFSPGGLHSASKAQGVDFGSVVLDDIERKVRCRAMNPVSFANSALATL